MSPSLNYGSAGAGMQRMPRGCVFPLAGWCLLFCVLTTLASCMEEKRYRTETGLLYRVVPSKAESPVITMGQTAKIRYWVRVGDSLTERPENRMPLYYMVLPRSAPYNPLEVFDYGMHKGDSVIVTQRVDSMLEKKIFTKLAPWMKKSDLWITYIKVLDVFTGDSLLQADKRREAEQFVAFQRGAGSRRIAAYLKKRGLRAEKDSSLYIETVVRGQGRPADSASRVAFDFSLGIVGGKVLNSSLDTAFHQPGPVEVSRGSGGFPPLLENLLWRLPAGSEVRVYLPAVELFGPEPVNRDVKPTDDLVLTLIIKEIKP